MSTNETLLQLALELAADYDSSLDTAKGSSFRTKFLDPLLTRVGGSPLDVDTETLAVERLLTEIPGIDVSAMSAARDLLVRAFTVMGEPYKREIAGLKVAQSLNNHEIMTRDEVDALLGNYYTRLQSGSTAGGTVRMYFPTPRSITVTPTTQFSTGSSLRFFPTTVQAISNVQMSFQQEGELYYFDVEVIAEAAGAAYGVAAGAISSVAGVSGVTRVSNPRKFAPGLEAETKAEGVARTRRSITGRNLITTRGVTFVLPEEFKALDTIQVIGRGDPEMLRDVIHGPVAISAIPGGAVGRNPLDVPFGQFVHIGGMTDVYIYQQVPDLEDVDIENLTDKGVRIHSSLTGFTAAGGSTSVFQDAAGFFVSRGVTAGDVLLIGADAFVIDAVSDETSLDLSPEVLDGSLYGVTYEIVRRGASDGEVWVPLYDLVAVDDDGATVFDDAGEPVAPVPGSPLRAALTDDLGVPVLKTENKASENVLLPLLRVTSLEFLDPLTLETSGSVIPMRDLLLAAAPDGLDGGASGVLAAGAMRLYFRDAVNCYVTRSATTFAFEGRTYRPVSEVSGTLAGVPDENVSEIKITGDYTSQIAIGDRFEFTSGAATGVAFCVLNTAFGGGKTTLTVREDLTDYLAGPEAETQTWQVHVGILEANMTKDAYSDLYYFDVEVEDLVTGAGGNQAADTTFAATNVFSEGWSLKTTVPVVSFSTRELPYLAINEWVNDTTRLFVTFTAPAVRVSYEYASAVAEVQAYADADETRVVSEDVLIRHFLPAYVRMSLVVKGMTAEDAQEDAEDYINALDPTEDLELSDLVVELSKGGSVHVRLPATMVALAQNADRSWSGLLSEDSLGSERTQHFIADVLTVTQE